MKVALLLLPLALASCVNDSAALDAGEMLAAYVERNPPQQECPR
jgi:hypothetical protein